MPKKKKQKNQINKEKALKYVKEYTSNGFNKSKAYMKVSDCKDTISAKGNAPRFHKAVIANECIREEFNLADIDADYIIGGIIETIKDSKKPSDKQRGLELLGKWRKLFSDSQVNVNTNIVNNAETVETYGKLLNRRQELGLNSPVKPCISPVEALKKDLHHNG